MDIFGFLSLVGGLVLFLFGMDIMGKALEQRAGSKLSQILSKLTASPLKGFFLGLVVTSIIQSSSATTVMVVGFVNSGIMQLSQAIGVIMGANVGTTVTAWILSLTGITGNSIFVKMLNPNSFTPVLALIGLIMYMFGKSDKKKGTGMILLGFSVLMFGMKAMSDAVAPLSNDESFIKLFTLFTNPFLGVLVGAVLTGIIQSSSASVGILQALSVTGAVTYGNAIPIIMGQNIGTCVTALISSVGTNKNARRAALVHLYFNIIGVIIFMILFYGLKSVIGFSFMGDQINKVGIAIIHTSFNVLATAIMLPFSRLLEKLARLTIKDKDGERGTTILDERLFETPALAVEQSRKLTLEMADDARAAIFMSLDLTRGYNREKAEKIREYEKDIDKYEDVLGTYLVRLSSRSLSVDDSHEISILLHTIGDFERISDHAVNVLRTAEEIRDKKIIFPDGSKREVDVLKNAIHEIVNLTYEAFETGSAETASRVEPLEQVIDGLTRELKSRHIERLKRGEFTIELGFILSDLMTNCERVADHCSNIAVAVIEVGQNSFDTHEYLNAVKSEGGSEFVDAYSDYSGKYKLN